jgi:hypothetical protein
MLVYDGSGLRKNYRVDCIEGFACTEPKKIGEASLDMISVKYNVPNDLPYALPISVKVEGAPQGMTIESKEHKMVGTVCKRGVPQTDTRTLKSNISIFIGLKQLMGSDSSIGTFHVHEVLTTNVFSSSQSNVDGLSETQKLAYVRIDANNVVGNRSNVGSLELLQPYNAPDPNGQQPGYVQLFGGSNYQITYKGSTDALKKLVNSNIFTFAICKNG